MTESNAPPRSRYEDRIRLRTRYERFGSLLTERQAALVRAYAVDGLSFSEIARRHNISRQAVHEAVRGAEKAMENYESKVGGLGTANIKRLADLDQAFNKLNTLKLKIARTGIIYSVDWIRREIDSVMGLLAENPEDGTETSSAPGTQSETAEPVELEPGDTTELPDDEPAKAAIQTVR
jgi:predicted DNA-binding protein YlxM (UPF0122 family)